jgi:hypothetical protein
MVNTFKRLTAFIVCSLLMTVLIYFFVLKPTIMVFSAITAQASVIEYNTTMYLVLGGIFLPLLQFVSLLERYFPKWFKQSIRARFFYGSVILFVIFGITMTFMIKHEVVQNGYTYCREASRHRNLSHFAVYVQDMETCRNWEAHSSVE